MEDLLSEIKKYDIQIRKIVNNHMHGNYKSVFKGSGIEFDDVRPYQYGDDTRVIHWNITAKGHGTYIKTFVEEKEQQINILLDVSASQNIGTDRQQKIDIGKRIAGILTLAGAREGSAVGLLCTSDQKELYYSPKKGNKHAHILIKKLENLKPLSQSTDLNYAFNFLQKRSQKRSIVIIISDFIDNGYEKSLQTLARKHDVIALHIFDPLEIKIPSLGIIPIQETETGKTYWANTSNGKASNSFDEMFLKVKDRIQTLSKKTNIDYVTINTKENFTSELVKVFNLRNRKGLKKS